MLIVDYIYVYHLCLCAIYKVRLYKVPKLFFIPTIVEHSTMTSDTTLHASVGGTNDGGSIEEDENLSPQEKARLLRLAAIEKRMKKNALPSQVRRTLNPPNTVSPVPPTPMTTGVAQSSTTSSGAPAPSLPKGDTFHSKQEQTAIPGGLTNPPSPASTRAEKLKTEQPLQNGEISECATTLPRSPDATPAAQTNDESAQNMRASNPVLEAALRRQQKNKAGGADLHWSARKKQLVNEIKAILNSKNEEPFFGMPSASEEVLENYLMRLKKKYSMV